MSRSSVRLSARPSVRAGVGGVAVLLLASTLTACGDDATGDDAAITVENCGAEVEFDGAPDKAVLLKSAAVPALHRLGVLDRVVARAGEYPEAYYDQATLDELAAVPSLTDKTDTSGHLQISREEIVAQQPDLVIGETESVSRDTLGSTGIRLLEEPAFCGSLEGEATFDDVYDQVRLYGEVFERDAEAEEYVAELQQRLDDVEAQVDPDEQRTVAVLYPTVGGGVTYAYGTGSMSHPVVTAAGLRNVFDDTDDRVFEVGVEELVGRDPDVLVLLYSSGDPAEVEAAIEALPGADSMTAVREGAMLPMLLNYAEPPTPLAVDGVERVIEFLQAPTS